MADFVFNQALGRVIEYCNRVESNDPTNAALILVVVNTSATDATLKDLDTLSAVLGDVNTAEVTNANYARKTLANGSLTISVTDGGDTAEVDFADQTWSAVGSGDSWTDLLVCYDSDTTAGDDTNIIPLTCHDFAATPNGGDITFQLHASGFFQAS